VVAALRGPQDLLPLGKEIGRYAARLGVAALREELALRRRSLEGQDVEALLVACLALHQQAVAFRYRSARAG
jgi:hypothetical protein